MRSRARVRGMACCRARATIDRAPAARRPATDAGPMRAQTPRARASHTRAGPPRSRHAEQTSPIYAGECRAAANLRFSRHFSASLRPFHRF